MVSEFKAKVCAWIGALSRLVRREVLLCQTQVYASKLGRTPRYPRVDLDAYVRRFNEKA